MSDLAIPPPPTATPHHTPVPRLHHVAPCPRTRGLANWLAANIERGDYARLTVDQRCDLRALTMEMHSAMDELDAGAERMLAEVVPVKRRGWRFWA